jgi:GTP-binding protein of the ras superfamily involved in termination of M-phase
MSKVSTSGEKEKKKAFIKVGLIGDNAVGKTSLMVKFVDGTFQEDYIVTLGIACLQS